MSRKSCTRLVLRVQAARLLGGLVVSCVLSMGAGAANESADQLLQQADAIKGANFDQFSALMQTLEQRSAELSMRQQQYRHYLRGWQSAYTGRYTAAIAALQNSVAESDDPTLRFRARVTMANVLAVATQYQEAFLQLNQFLALLPEVTDAGARQQGLAVAAYLYSQVGEYDLALSHAERILNENWDGRGPCRGGHARLEALFRSGRARSVTPDFHAVIEHCIRIGDMLRANTIRTHIARLHSRNNRPDLAIELLLEYYDEVRASTYARLIMEYESLLARAYLQQGNQALARQYAQSATVSAGQAQFAESIVGAYRVLYEVARDQRDFSAALAFHEKLAAADKGYLDDVSARQLAYERVRNESFASRLQIDALNKENEVLQLQRELGNKAAEASRLYIALLLSVLACIGMWAYRTKRSQLHFKRLSQIDSLTGIANRPRFIDLAESTLDNSRRTQQQVSVVLCDLDHFKLINDKYGHAAGDSALKQAVAACQPHLRSSDIFGRLGGEEFCVLLPGCNLADARQRAEQLRLAIAAIPLQHDNVEANMSASFGVAETSSSGYELRQLLAHADTALYEAKNAGRNRVVLYDSERAVSTLCPAAQDALLSGAGH